VTNEGSIMAYTAGRRTFAFSILTTVAIGLGACQTKTAGLMGTDPVETASTGETAPSFKRTEELKKKWSANPGDKVTGLAYAENLGALGESAAQLDVLKTLARNNPNDAALLSKTGKQALAAGQGTDAVQILEQAAALPSVDWQTLNALGSAYDQQGRHAEARQKYQAALQLNPSQVSVKNNLAMSYAVEGKLPEAETRLRTLLDDPVAKVGLQGRFDEAREIASKDLPPDQVEANLAYLQQMLAQPNTWQQLSEKQG
jgi:Flp pilus assembly protein TadD